MSDITGIEHAETIAREGISIGVSKGIWASSSISAIVAFFGSNYALVLFSILGVILGLIMNWWMGMQRHRREALETAQRIKHNDERMAMEREALEMKREQHMVIMNRESINK